MPKGSPKRTWAENRMFDCSWLVDKTKTTGHSAFPLLLPQTPRTEIPSEANPPASRVGFNPSSESTFSSVPRVVECQLVERATTVVVTGGTAVAAVDGYSDELVPVRKQAFIRERTVVIGSCGCIRCTEGVQDLEAGRLP